MAGWNLTGNAVSAEFDGSDEQERKELSVSQAVEIAAGALDAIPQLSVLGEVTGFRGPNARSGHCYFQIKDDSAAVDCIIWKGAYLKRTFDLRDGMQVSFKGSFNLYKATGRMSFVARSFSLAGEGLLRQQVAQLAEKLRREGLMDEARKRRIPVFCSRVAVVTSLSGAVIDDVKRTLRRRNPLVDTSICDMVSDRRASTPTAAAESVAPAMTELADVLEARHQRLGAAMASMIGSNQVDLEMLDQRGRRAWDTYTARLGDALDAAACRPCLNDPTFMVERRESELALTADRLSGAIVRSVGTFRSNFERLPERLVASTSGLDGKRHALTLASSRLEHQGRTMLSKPASDLGRAAASLDALSPLKVLARGYSIAYSDDGVATSAKTFKPGDAIRVRMADGNVAATVDTVE